MRRAAFMIITASLMAITTAYAADYNAWFPAPLKNWTAGKITYTESKVDSLSGKPAGDTSKSDPLGLFTITHSQVVREYYAPDKKGGLAIMFDNYDCFADMMITKLHTDAEFRHKMGNSVRPVKVKGFFALESYNKKKEKEMVSIKLGDCKVAVIGGRDISAAAISSYVNKLNLKTIGKALE